MLGLAKYISSFSKICTTRLKSIIRYKRFAFGIEFIVALPCKLLSYFVAISSRVATIGTQSSMLSIAKFMKAEQQMSINRASALVGGIVLSSSACLMPPASLV
ncbi:hypothetical protein D3C80_970300 [compost metagenome]